MDTWKVSIDIDLKTAMKRQRSGKDSTALICGCAVPKFCKKSIVLFT